MAMKTSQTSEMEGYSQVELKDRSNRTAALRRRRLPLAACSCLFLLDHRRPEPPLDCQAPLWRSISSLSDRQAPHGRSPPSPRPARHHIPTPKKLSCESTSMSSGFACFKDATQ
ncbi:hypothetical protein J5N97_026005 [Dioscorea zingiberensis]|uniref:Uncharacterized protein n=1 Tax=Dioscorea zingiberensis TaxID=325984 RepID=A0A9D5C1I9_9LILI|nr:hypothetical protein J5N97_026005 [Dioscorea zingiberensis]